MARILFISSIICVLCSSCNDNDVGKTKVGNGDAIYFDYKVKGEEDDSNVTIYLQFRMGGRNGTTLVLSDPAKVQLDDEVIPIDSAKLTGAYYEIQRPANGFAGNHTITFIDINNEEYKEEFTYQPFKLKTKIPAAINRGDIAFDFAGLESEDYVRVILTDTAFHNRDIHEIDTVKNNRLIITADELKNLVDGPINLQLYKEIERPVTSGTRGGGRIVVSYGIEREFELRDQNPQTP